jgi:anti-sigma factor RsiW
MNCSDAEGLIAAQLDAELDAVRGRALEAHLLECPACAAERASLRGLKSRIVAAAPYHRAPPALRREVERQVALADAAVATVPRSRTPPALSLPGAGRRTFAAGALAGAATVTVGWLAGTAWLERQADNDLARHLVDAHVRAGLADQRIAVASSDQHTVKPWLSARLDYAPPVIENPVAGIELVGARIESIERRRVATLVYRYRAHWIDVFVVPVSGRAVPEGTRSIRGFNVVQESGGEMEWRAVSDASGEVLQPLVARLAQAGR